MIIQFCPLPHKQELPGQSCQTLVLFEELSNNKFIFVNLTWNE